MFRSMGQRAKVGPQARTDRRGSRHYQSVLGANALIPPALTPDLTAIKQPGKAEVRRRVWFDAPLLMVLIVLLVFGAIMLYSASYDFSYLRTGNSMTLFLRQLMWIAIGVVGMIFLTWTDYHVWARWAWAALLGTLGLLVMVQVLGNNINNATRTLTESGSIQPSELAKFVVVYYLAVWLHSKREILHDISYGLLPLGVLMGLVGGLILKQPDYSALLTVMMLGGLMFFLAGGELKQIGVVLIIAMVMSAGVVTFTSTGINRWEWFVAGLSNIANGADQVIRSFDAFIRGGWFGVGIGYGVVKVSGLQAPYTDTIFAVIGEETGTVGALTVVGLFLLLMWRGFRVAYHAPDMMGRLLAGGFTLWICLEAFFNIGGMLNLLPISGNALPFISLGGSSMVSCLAGMGMVLSVSRQSVKKKDEEASLFNAVVNLRRWDRRRRVSGVGRSTSHASASKTARRSSPRG